MSTIVETNSEDGLSSFRDFCAKLEQWIALVVEIPGAIFLGLEVVVLFAGVAFRYALHSPLVWSDELATILFFVAEHVRGRCGSTQGWPHASDCGCRIGAKTLAIPYQHAGIHVCHSVPRVAHPSCP